MTYSVRPFTELLSRIVRGLSICRKLGLVILSLFSILSGQPTLTFEVASVKHVAPKGGPGDTPRNMDSNPGHFAMRNVPLRYCLEWAYDLKDFEISGPNWIKGDERYDILATAPGATEPQMRQMLQALLIERFRMKLHRETRELGVYWLVPGKGSAKVKSPATDGEPGLSGPQTALLFHRQPLSRLTFLLSRRMDRPVFDHSGLDGTYDYTVDISGLNDLNVPSDDDQPAPSIFTAVETGLGLKLESRRQPIEILVIDSVSRVPTEN